MREGNPFKAALAEDKAENRKYLEKAETPVRKTVEEMEKAEEEPKEEKPEEKKATPKKPAVEKKMVSDDLGIERRERKTVRKNFLLTPSVAAWMEKTAKRYNISMNELLRVLCERQMEKEK